jgi:hypothetical protein
VPELLPSPPFDPGPPKPPPPPGPPADAPQQALLVEPGAQPIVNRPVGPQEPHPPPSPPLPPPTPYHEDQPLALTEVFVVGAGCDIPSLK